MPRVRILLGMQNNEYSDAIMHGAENFFGYSCDRAAGRDIIPIGSRYDGIIATTTLPITVDAYNARGGAKFLAVAEDDDLIHGIEKKGIPVVLKGSPEADDAIYKFLEALK